MANRRLISKNILYSESFADLSPEALKLYIFLILEADDDGFIGHVRQVIKIADAKRETLDMLINRGLILEFKSHVCVIVHWLSHNLINRSGYTKTEFLAERAQVYINDENQYVLT
jgi:hypothetical protein